MLSAEKYQPYIIKDYIDWTLFLHEKQFPYIGRCYAWWKDSSPHEGELMRPSDLGRDELLELNNTIFDEVVDACAALGYQVEPYGDKFLLNMSYLANMPEHNHHMHWHFVPRTSIPIVLAGLNLRTEDVEWGKHYAKPPLGEEALAHEKLLAIRQLMANTIGGNA